VVVVSIVLFALYVAASERSHFDEVNISALQIGNLTVFNCRLEYFPNTHSNLYIIFVIIGNFDEMRTRSGLILLISQPKLRERKETNNL